MSGRFVIKWVHSIGCSSHSFLKVARRFSVEKRKAVPFIEWEPTSATATSYGSAEAALSDLARLGYAKSDYVEVVEV